MRGGLRRIGKELSRAIPAYGSDFARRVGEKHARWIPIVPVWRHTVRATDGLQTTITPGPVHGADQTLSLDLDLQMTLPMPNQDEHRPDQIEAAVHQVGLEVPRRLFRVLIEKADQELVLQQRHGKGDAGIQRRGTRPFTFKTIFGEVPVPRSRILHKQDGSMEVPSAVAWNTSHQRMITQNLRDAVCDPMGARSAGKSRADVCADAGDEDLVGQSTIIDIVHHEGAPLVAAPRARARAILDDTSEAHLALLGPAAADPDAVTGLLDDDRRSTTRRKPRRSGTKPRPSGLPRAFPGANRRFRWPRARPAWWTRDS